MNRTRKLFWASLALLLVMCLVLLFHKKQTSMINVGQNDSTNNDQAEVQKPVVSIANRPLNTNTSVLINTPKQILPSQMSQKEQWRLAVEAKNAPIDFLGKVIDQNEVPLGGVRVIASIRSFMVDTNDTGVAFSSKTNLVTGSDGIFEVHGMKGDSLQIETLEKDGYEKEPGTFRVFSYDLSQNFVPHADAPVVFKLWQKEIKQPLISGDKFSRIIPDGRAYTIDLMKGTISETANEKGDLQISVKRPEGIRQGQKYYEWSFSVKSQDGGILQELDDNAAMYSAPTDGYTDIYEYKHPASQSGWGSESGDKRFYVKVHGQLFGRIIIAVNTFFDGNIPGYNTGDGTLTIHYVLNPSGSSVLR
jgi:hypothetical protein